VDPAMKLLEKNRKSATSPDLLKAAVTDLEREQLNPDYWGDSNADRADAAQQSEYSRVVLSRLKQCSGDNDRDAVKVALEILQEDRENTDSNSGLSAQLLKADA
jgi:hypothetical protein